MQSFWNHRLFWRDFNFSLYQKNKDVLMFVPIIVPRWTTSKRDLIFKIFISSTMVQK